MIRRWWHRLMGLLVRRPKPNARVLGYWTIERVDRVSPWPGSRHGKPPVQKVPYDHLEVREQWTELTRKPDPISPSLRDRIGGR